MHDYGNGSDWEESVANQLATLVQLQILVESQQAPLNSKLPIRCATSTCGVSIQEEIIETGSGGDG